MEGRLVILILKGEKRELSDKILNIKSAIVTINLKTKSFMEFKLRQSYFQNEIKVLWSKLNELDYLNQNAVRIIDYYQIEERGLKDNLARRISRLESLMINNSFLEIKNTEDLEKEISELLERKDRLVAEFNKYNLKADSCYPEILQRERESKNMLADCKRAQSRVRNLESELEKHQEMLQQNKVMKQLKEVSLSFCCGLLF